MVLAALLAIVLAASAAGAPSSGERRDVLASRLLAQLNGVRAQHGLSSLRASVTLRLAAASHTREMATQGYFAHESADGTAPARRIARWYSPGGWALWSVGENLLWSAPPLGAPNMVALWLASPEHRQILLDPTWREIGIYAVRVASAPGVYAGRPVTIVTADFGVRR